MQQKPLILSVDAALGPCSVALLSGTGVLAQAREERLKEQSRQLVLMIEHVLKSAGQEYASLDEIISTVGPGTFTGLRIGLAAARGIGFAAKKPVRGVSTLLAAAVAASHLPPGASQVAGNQNILIALNAGKGEAYIQLFAPDLTPLSTPSLAAPARLPDARMAGNMPEGWAGRPQLAVMPDAAAAGLAALLAPAQVLPPEPLYIRPPDAKPQS